MRRSPPLVRPLPLRIASAALPCLAAAAALAQDAPPDGIGTDLLEISRQVLPAAPQAAPETSPAAADPRLADPRLAGAAGSVPAPQDVADAGADGDPPPPDAGDAPALAAETAPPPSGAPAPERADAGTEAERAAGATAPPGPAGGSPERRESAAPAKAPGPAALLKGLWREAVAAGATSEGFAAWLAAALDPAHGAPAESHAARTRAAAAAWDRRTAPVTLGEAGRVVTVFGAAIPVAHCSPLTVCYVELEPGEVLTDTPSWGDTARWQVVAKVQGRDPETVVLEVKPAADAVETNLVIPTDRRLYTITLVNDPAVHTPILAFRWPDSEARAIAEGIARRRAEETAAAEARAAEASVRAGTAAAELARSGVPTEAGPRAAELLDFRFRVDGDAPFRPVRVFADGARTYIDLHPRYRGPLPVIVAGKAEGNAALNTRVSAGGGRIIADRVIADVWLRSGKRRVRIRRDAR